MMQSDAYRHTVPAPDLLNRLRKIEQGDGYGDHVTQWYRNPDGLEAADEIERLRDIIQTYAAICKVTDESQNPR
jgi:hypothetical protein